jgi:hypothetical protein
MSQDLTIRDRVSRSAIVAVVGAMAGLILMLSIDFWKRPYAADSFLLEAALLGAGVGAVMGFFFTDSDWLGVLRRR